MEPVANSPAPTHEALADAATAASQRRRGFPVHPELPEMGEGGRDIFRVFHDRLEAWKGAINVWLQDKPEKKAIIWQEAPSKHGPGNVRALTRSIEEPGVPWRVTCFYPSRDGKSLLPAGHQIYKTRGEAMAEEAEHAYVFHDKLPAPVLDEQQIQGYKLMKDLPDDAKLHWYKLAKHRSFGELRERLRGTVIMESLVLDSHADGRVGFTSAFEERHCDHLGLSPEIPDQDKALLQMTAKLEAPVVCEPAMAAPTVAGLEV